MDKRKGISLIVLVITILVMIILAGVVIVSLSKNNPIDRAHTAKNLTNLKAIEEEINLYITTEVGNSKKNLKLLPLVRDKQGKEITANNIFTQEDLQKISKELREIIFRLQIPFKDLDMEYSIDKVDFSNFFVLDTNYVPSAKVYKNRFLVYALDNEYILISLDGIRYNKKVNYIVLPIGREIGAQFIAGENNTYKLYANGDLKAIGQKNSISGQDVDDYSGYKEVEYLKSFPGYKIFKVIDGAAFLIDAKDDLYVWGKNSSNRFGLGNSYIQMKPVHILKGKKVKDVWCGELNIYVKTIDGELYAAGSNVHGALCKGNTNIYNSFVKINTPFDVNTLEKVFPSLNKESNNAVFVCNLGNEKRIYAVGHNFSSMFAVEKEFFTNIIDITNKHSDFKFANQVSFSGQNLSFRKDNKLYITGRGGLWGQIPFENGTGSFKEVANNCAIISEYGNLSTYIGTDGYIYRCANRFYAENIYQIFLPYLKSENINVGIQNVEIDSEGRIIKNKNEVFEAKFDHKNKILKYEKFNISKLKNIDPSKYIYNVMFTNTDNKVISPYWEVTSAKNRIQIESKYIKNNISKIAIYKNQINLLDKEGYIWKDLKNIDTDLKEKVIKIVMDNDAKVALTASGKVYIKGNGRIGGTGNIINKEKFTQLKYANGKLVNDVKNIYMFKDREPVLLFLTKDNRLYMIGAFWGYRFPNQNIDWDTGNPPSILEDVRLYPVRLKSLALDSIVNKIKDIHGTFTLSDGKYFKNIAILTTDGDVYGYGDSKINGLNKSVEDFTKVDLPRKARMIKSTYLNTFTLLDNGDVYAWGYNRNGEFGTGKEIGKFYSTPVKLELPGKVVEFELGEGFSIFGLANGKVFGSGKNEFGQLGTKDTNSTSNFVNCVSLEDKYIQ